MYCILWLLVHNMYYKLLCILRSCVSNTWLQHAPWWAQTNCLIPLVQVMLSCGVWICDWLLENWPNCHTRPIRGDSRNFCWVVSRTTQHQCRFRDLWKEELSLVADLWSRGSGDTVPQKPRVTLFLKSKMMPIMKIASHLIT